ncbi:UDP-N-acetylglucosamine 1-carboxyvinyltransferase [Candidatus Wolfebacteria bacterium]|nr:UDP-N-acetylglucosamine 1-carboxyvinyltransferase [Candidatus Wolfebacteria bacterium]
MARFVIRGGKPLRGEIAVSGAKNAVLKIFPVALLSEETIRVTNAPDIEDARRAEEMLRLLGGTAERKGGALELGGPTKGRCVDLPADLVNKFRASILFVGPLLATCGEVNFPHPGGCALGAVARPIDMFLDGFRKMGAHIAVKEDSYRLTARKLKGAEIFFHKVTVTGTESLMMTAVLADGVTVLKNCAMEPEISALADYLNRAGAKIEGAGTPSIRIAGAKKLRGGEYAIIPDRIEAGTLAMLGAAIPGSDFRIVGSAPEHLEALWAQFDRIGARYEISTNSVRVRGAKKLMAADIVTHEYPGFVTDLQPPYTVLMTQARGSSLIHETIYDRRLLFTDLLSQMGANITMADPHRVVVHGKTPLYGRKMASPDLRAGIALVLAALVANGETQIDNIYQIERGYEKLESRLQRLGADIKRAE